MTDNQTPAATATLARPHAISWGAIILGLVVTVAIQILLGLLGLGLGFAIVDPSDPMLGLGSWGVATAIYVIITQLIALFVGGYVAARLNPSITSMTAMTHGLAIWSLATISMVFFGLTSAGATLGGVSNAVTAIGKATGSTVEAVIPDNISLADMRDQLKYIDLPEPVRETLRENDITAENFQQEVRAAYRDVISVQEERRLQQGIKEGVKDIVQSPGDALTDIDETITELLGQGAVLSEQDLNELEATLQRRLNLSDEEVDQIADQLRTAAKEAETKFRTAVKDARKQSIAAAEATSDTISSMAFWLFIASLLGLGAAVIGGKKGEVDPV